MKTKFLVVLLAVASTFAACKKDKNDNPAPEETKLPTGTYRLIESVNYPKEGKDSTSVKFKTSNLTLTFDQEKKTANIVGKPELIQVVGSYKAETNNTLTDAKIVTAKIAASENDLMVIALLEKGDAFENKGLTVTLKAKGNGYLVFSMQK